MPMRVACVACGAEDVGREDGVLPDGWVQVERSRWPLDPDATVEIHHCCPDHRPVGDDGPSPYIDVEAVYG